MPMPVFSTKERLTEAAFALFDERGFEATTVDHIAERAGVGRTTFFRLFRSKEDVIFPDHDALLAVVGDRLDASTSAHAAVAVSEAARLVLQHYLAEGERARSRFRLTSTVPALREREIAGQGRYQRTFRHFIQRWMGDDPESALLAELMANAVVTAHNHVLRRWLREETSTPVEDFDRAMAKVVALFEPSATGASEGASEGVANLVVLRTTRSLEQVVAALRPLSLPE
jgi:AcrR family transcriptional regulator